MVVDCQSPAAPRTPRGPDASADASRVPRLPRGPGASRGSDRHPTQARCRPPVDNEGSKGPKRAPSSRLVAWWSTKRGPTARRRRFDPWLSTDSRQRPRRRLAGAPHVARLAAPSRPPRDLGTTPADPSRTRRATRVRSVAVAVRVRPAPRPGRPDHRLQARPLRTPAEDLGGTRGPGDEDRRIARPPRADTERDGRPDHGLGRLDDLADREAAAVAEVADERLVRPGIARRGRLDRPQVRVGEVRDVDVVAQARPVGGRIVVAEDRSARSCLRRRRGRSG